MNVAKLRSILADAPDDAPITVVLNNLTGWSAIVTDGEVIDDSVWGGDGDYLMLQIDREVNGTATVYADV